MRFWLLRINATNAPVFSLPATAEKSSPPWQQGQDYVERTAWEPDGSARRGPNVPGGAQSCQSRRALQSAGILKPTEARPSRPPRSEHGSPAGIHIGPHWLRTPPLGPAGPWADIGTIAPAATNRFYLSPSKSHYRHHAPITPNSYYLSLRISLTNSAFCH